MEYQNEQLLSSENQALLGKMLSNLVRSAVVPIILVNRQGHIVFLNHAYEEWSGVSCENVLGRHISMVVENTRTHITAMTGKAELQQVQKCFGKIVLSNRIPIFDENDELLGAWGIVDVNDISGITNLSKRITQLERQLSKYENELRTYQSVQHSFADIIGHSPVFEAVIEEAKLAANIAVDVLIRGESGVGKKLFAHAIHHSSARSRYPFVSVSCDGLPYDQVDEMLFGTERGFLNNEVRIGKVESADKGTLFLDEIGDLPLEVQPKILRLIEGHSITRVGGENSIDVDIRVIASTNCNLEDMVKSGAFRADLYYALTAFVLVVPPLRKRKEDIPELVDHFIGLYSEIYNRKKKAFTPAAIQEMMQQDWPGNVRELSNFVKSTMIRTPEEALGYTLLNKNYDMEDEERPSAASAADDPEKGNMTMRDMELKLIQSALKSCKGNVRKSAQMLNMDRNTFYRRLKKYQINSEDYRMKKQEEK